MKKTKRIKPLVRKPSKHNFIFSKGEEIFNAVTHIVGGALSVVGLVLLLIYAEGLAQVIAVTIYGVCNIVLYTVSAIYHFLRPNRAKRVFRVFDHCAIFLLIAGTYTTFCLVTLSQTTVGTGLLIFVWLVAILGVVFNAINMHHPIVVALSQVCYIVLGWCVLFTISPVIQSLEFAGLMWLVAGGVAYTSGVVFFALGNRVKYFHSVWHIFVMLGGIFQFISVFMYVL